MRLACESLEDCCAAVRAAADWLESEGANRLRHCLRSCACDVCQSYRRVQAAVEMLGAETRKRE